MNPRNLYHTGIVVDDVEAAKSWYKQVLGYRFTTTAGAGHEQVVELADGRRTIADMLITYSLDEPRIEFVSSIAGTIWQPTSAGVHHLGYWSEDVDGELATLLAAGAEFEARSLGPDGKALWAYCRHPVHGRIELVGSMMRAMTEAWWAQGEG